MSERTQAGYWLDLAQSTNTATDPLAQIAAALTGILAAITEHAAEEDREDFLQGKWDECDAALGRVLELADTLDANPHATLKPTAFSALAAKMRAAVDGEDA